MRKDDWVVLEKWYTQGNCRMIFSDREHRVHLIDIVLPDEISDFVVREVLGMRWTCTELISFLNEKVQTCIPSKIK